MHAAANPKQMESERWIRGPRLPFAGTTKGRRCDLAITIAEKVSPVGRRARVEAKAASAFRTGSALTELQRRWACWDLTPSVAFNVGRYVILSRFGLIETCQKEMRYL